MVIGILLAAWTFLESADALVGNPAPNIISETWLNSAPLHLSDLKGKVVMVEFWTFGCYNCRNLEPYVKQWHQKYADKGLVVIGVHSPEFSYERALTKVSSTSKNTTSAFRSPSITIFRRGIAMATATGRRCI